MCFITKGRLLQRLSLAAKTEITKEGEKNMRLKEFWKVEIKENDENKDVFFVTANSAASAERKALTIAREEMPHDDNLYCVSAEFVGYIHL